jgi:hypothetical protein
VRRPLGGFSRLWFRLWKSHLRLLSACGPPSVTLGLRPRCPAEMSGWPYANHPPSLTPMARATNRALRRGRFPPPPPEISSAPPLGRLFSSLVPALEISPSVTLGLRPAAAAPRITRYTPPWQSCGGSAYNRVAMTGTRAGFERSATGPTTIHDYSGRGRSGRVPPTPKSARNGVHGL